MDYCLAWVTSVFTIILVIFVVLLFDIDTQTVFMCSTTDRLGGIYQLELVLGHSFLHCCQCPVFSILVTDVGASLLT